jgi:hypothetical protein
MPFPETSLRFAVFALFGMEALRGDPWDKSLIAIPCVTGALFFAVHA